jgi:hypothetical protein
LKTGGEKYGIAQISGELRRIKCTITNDDSMGFWTYGKKKEYRWEIQKGDTMFNHYVNPGEHAFWNEQMCSRDVHGLHAHDPRILSTENIDSRVWSLFNTSIDENLQDYENAILVAYNGETCDLRWIWKLTQASKSTNRTRRRMPTKIKFFLDPLHIIKNYSQCTINKKIQT